MRLFIRSASLVCVQLYMELIYQLAPQLIYTECSRPTQTDMDTYLDPDVTVAFVVHGAK